MKNVVFLFLQKEHVLGLVVGNDNWWRTHGIRCSSPEETAGSGGGSGMGRSLSGDTCLLSYTTIETIHAAIFMLLTVNISIPQVTTIVKAILSITTLYFTASGDNICAVPCVAVFSRKEAKTDNC